MWQLLRMAASIFFLLLFLVCASLWVQSYRIQLILDTGRNPIPWGPFLVSTKGIVDLGIRNIRAPTKSNPFPIQEPWTVDLYLLEIGNDVQRGYWGFDVQLGRLWRLSAPHWFLLIVTGLSAVYLKPKPRNKISLRETLLFATLTAGCLGVVFNFVKYQN